MLLLFVEKHFFSPFPINSSSQELWLFGTKLKGKDVVKKKKGGGTALLFILNGISVLTAPKSHLVPPLKSVIKG